MATNKTAQTFQNITKFVNITKEKLPSAGIKLNYLVLEVELDLLKKYNFS